MKRILSVAVVVVVAGTMIVLSSYAVQSSDPGPTPHPIYFPFIARRFPLPTPTPTPTPTPIPQINPTPAVEVPEFFDALQVLPPALGGDWVELTRHGDDHWDELYAWEYSRAVVKFENPNAVQGEAEPYRIVYTVWVTDGIEEARDWMALGRNAITLPNFVRCGRTLTGLPEFGMDRFGAVSRTFSPSTQECYPADERAIMYYMRFRIANVVVGTKSYAYNDDDALRLAYLVYYAQIIEQCVRDRLAYN